MNFFSTDLHPPNYAQKTGHLIEPPLNNGKLNIHFENSFSFEPKASIKLVFLSIQTELYKPPSNDCGIRGCRGIGNAKDPEVKCHKTTAECPYDFANWQHDERASRLNRIDKKNRIVNNSFNVGAGPCRTRITTNPALEKPTVSLQPFLNPTELAALSPKEIELFRRLQVSAKFLMDNRKTLEKPHQQWVERVQPTRNVEISAAKNNPLNWDKNEVAEFVMREEHCSMLGEIFIEHEIDGLAFLSLRQDDLIDRMKISLGNAIKIFNRIILLREECNVHYIKYT